MRRVAVTLFSACLIAGIPAAGSADSIGTATLTWHFGAATASRAFGLNQSGGGGINYYDSQSSQWVWGSILASDWPSSDGQGNSVTGSAGPSSGSEIAQALGFAAHGPSASVGAWSQAYFGNSWYLPNTSTLEFSVDWAFTGQTDQAPAPGSWALLFAFQMAVDYNNGLPGSLWQELECYSDYHAWDPTTGFPYYMAYNATGYNDGVRIQLDGNGRFSAGGTTSVSCDASSIFGTNGRWVVDYNVAGSGSDFHPNQQPPEVPEPATMLLLGTGLVGAAYALRHWRK